MTDVLSVQGVTAGHGKVVGVRDVDVRLGAGEVLAVLGPNGAGKSTLMKALAGLLPRMSGEVVVDGQPLASGHPIEANRSGVVLVPDNRALFSSLTVRETVQLARVKGNDRGDAVLDLFPALHDRLKVKAGSLSGGEQQMLVLARALVQSPRVLLIDEMSLGLAPIIVEDLLPIVRSYADDTGASVILVEQHVHLALEVADAAMVLVHGDVSLQEQASVLRSDSSRLEAAYLGS